MKTSWSPFVLGMLIVLPCILHNTIAQGFDGETDEELIKIFEQGLENPDTNEEEVRPDSQEPSSESGSPPVPSSPIGPEEEKDHVVPQTKVKPGPPPSPNLPVPRPHNSGEFDTLNENDPCSCVKYFLCDIENGTVVTNGEVLGLIDIRLGGPSSNVASPCKHYFDICCKQPKNPPDLPDLTDVVHKTCGKRNVDGVGFRITGALDGEAQFGEFPWMAAIVRQEPQSGGKPPLNIFLCGGSLIHPKVILTAGHCVIGKNSMELKVRLGEWDTQTPDELYPHQDRLVNKIIVHENYYAGALFNDLALLILDEEVKFAPSIDTVCLPPPNVNFDGQRCFASGWGKDTFGQEGKYQVILKRVDLPVVPREKCESALRKTRLGPYFKLHESFVCAGGEPGRDTCRGDGGSPLVCKLPNSPYYAQLGIVAWGIGCGEAGTPGVYVNVPKFVPWIDEKLSKLGLEPQYYKNS